MNVSLAIRQRLEALNLGQRDLARAAQVTESYISQLLRKKQIPPAPDRTDIYEKLDKVLKLRRGELAKLADLQRREQLRKKHSEPATALYAEVRELVLRKCVPAKQLQVRSIFEKQSFGELERFITQKLLDVVKSVAREELANERWLRRMARHSRTSYEEMRVTVLEFLDTDVFGLSMQSCVSFLQPVIASWDIDLLTLKMNIVLNPRIARTRRKTFEFVERAPDAPPSEEPGYIAFVADRSLSAGATSVELDILRRLQFDGRQPTALYYYRELQSLRDPLHFTIRRIGLRTRGRNRNRDDDRRRASP
jgi:transcriptional regulator with XRE-family HTH domain